MDKLIASNSVDNAERPAAPGAGTPEYATDGPPGTTIEAYHYNSMIDELCNVITGAGLALDRTNNAQLLAAIGLMVSAAMPSGTVLWFAADTAPAGFLECNGASVLRATYPALFAVIGVVFGSVNGTHFNLPPLSGQFIRGWDDGAGVDPGRAFGSSQADAFASHQHAVKHSDDNGSGAHIGHGSNLNDTDESELTGDTETRPKNVALLPCIKI